MADISFNYEDQKDQGGVTFNYEAPQFDYEDKTPQVYTVKDLRKEYGRGFTQEDFMKDPRLMKIVDDDLLARYPSQGGFIQGAADVVTGLAGGSTLSGWQKLDKKDRFELWQNHQRSFAGGQTVTTANELGLVSTADDKTKNAMGAGYELFGEMENIFTGDNVSWADTFDGFRDYAAATIWDPTTLLGLGIGRAFTMGGSKAAGEAVKISAKEAVKIAAQKGASKAAQKAIEKKVLQRGFEEVGKQSAKAAAKRITGTTLAKDLAAYGATDLVSSVGTDIAYQNVLMDTGAQEQYSYAQTALSALGTLVVPSIVYGSKGAAGLVKGAVKDTKLASLFDNYKSTLNITKGLTPEKVGQSVWKGVKQDMVTKSLEDTFTKFKRFKKNFEAWTPAVVDAKKFVKGRDLGMDDKNVNELFWRTFLFGEPSTKSGLKAKVNMGQVDDQLAEGYIVALKNAGLNYVPRQEDDTITNFIGDSLAWLPKATVKQLRDDFEEATGKRLDFLTSPKAFSTAFKARQSYAGQVLNENSLAYRMMKDKGLTQSMLEGLSKVTKEESADYLHYAQSVWKRMLTSHYGTTMLNIKGWALTSSMNTMADFVTGVLNGGQAFGKMAMGDMDGARFYTQAAKSTVLGNMKRGYRFLNPNATKADFDQFMSLVPGVEEEIFRELAGDVGPSGAAQRFNIPDNAVTGGIEKGVDFIQGVTGVKLQDEVTKQLSFMSALDQNMMKVYGKSYNDLASTPEGVLMMKSDDFFDKVVSPSIDRTLRETYSKTWSRQPGKSLILNVAKMVEKVSNDPTFGYFIPFGKFFNTSMATMGDYTGVNFIRHVGKRVFNDKVSWSHEAGAELLAKGIVGWSTSWIMGEKGEQKIESGLAWNQEMNPDGSITDVTYDFPESLFHAAGQMFGYVRRGEEIPQKLAEEVIQIAGAQTFRASEDVMKEFTSFVTEVAKMNGDEAMKQAMEIGLGGLGKVTSGLTRPLDPINTGAMIMTGDYETADRRQGVKFWNEATRYVDKIFPEEFLYGKERDKRNYPTTSKTEINVGKAIGVREAQEPSPIDTMLNSIGARGWNTIQWDGPPEVKNRLDKIIAPILNTAAQKALAKYPDFFERDVAEREQIVNQIVTSSKARAKDILKLGAGDDKVLNLMMEIDALPKKDLQRAKDRLGIEKDLEDIATEPGGAAKLEMLLHTTKNFDDIFHYDIQ